MNKLLLITLLIAGLSYGQESEEVIDTLYWGTMPADEDYPKRKLLYDGYCGWAIYKGYTYKADPNIYLINSGDTIRFYNKATKAKWEKVNRSHKKAPREVADENWKKIVAKG